MALVLYDTTLRDGAQREGISFSVDDKLKIARRLDRLGVAYIEGGWPGSNPKDMAFFERASELHLEQAIVTAFGSTRRADTATEKDANLCSIIPALMLKMGHDCITDEQLRTLTETARYVSELANLSLDARLPYVGHSAFAHKGGIHVNALVKCEASYQHVEPGLVGKALADSLEYALLNDTGN